MLGFLAVLALLFELFWQGVLICASVIGFLLRVAFVGAGAVGDAALQTGGRHRAAVRARWRS